MSEPTARVRRRSISASVTRGALSGQGVDGAEVQLPDLADQRQVPADLIDAREMLGGLHDQTDRTGVFEDPLDLRRRAGLVDRHHHRAGVEEREIHERPLVRRACEEADLPRRAGCRGRSEALRQSDDSCLEVGCGDVAPAVAVGHGEERTIRSGFDALHQQVGDVRVGHRPGTIAGTSNWTTAAPSVPGRHGSLRV